MPSQQGQLNIRVNIWEWWKENHAKIIHNYSPDMNILGH